MAFGIKVMKIESWLAGFIFIIENSLFEIIWFLESNCDSSLTVTNSDESLPASGKMGFKKERYRLRFS
jgi:hypothetical protein